MALQPVAAFPGALEAPDGRRRRPNGRTLHAYRSDLLWAAAVRRDHHQTRRSDLRDVRKLPSVRRESRPEGELVPRQYGAGVPIARADHEILLQIVDVGPLAAVGTEVRAD